MYYCDLSLTKFVKLELREQGTNLYGDSGQFDERHGVNSEIWNQWLYANKKWGCGLSGTAQQVPATSLAIFNVKSPAILNIARDNLGNLTKRRHLSAHFSLKYRSKDGISRDHFHCKNFPKMHTFRPAKKG